MELFMNVSSFSKAEGFRFLENLQQKRSNTVIFATGAVCARVASGEEVGAFNIS